MSKKGDKTLILDKMLNLIKEFSKSEKLKSLNKTDIEEILKYERNSIKLLLSSDIEELKTNCGTFKLRIFRNRQIQNLKTKEKMVKELILALYFKVSNELKRAIKEKQEIETNKTKK